MDPSTGTLNLDPDPGFWPNLDPYTVLCLFYFLENIFLKKLQENTGTGRHFGSVGSMNGEFLFLILHILPVIYPFF